MPEAIRKKLAALCPEVFAHVAPPCGACKEKRCAFA